MEFSTVREDDAVVVTVEGDVDVSNVGALRQRMDEILASGEHNFVIDLSGVEVMDGSGLATLVYLFNQARMGNGDVRICGLGPELKRAFDLIRLDRVFDAFDQCDEAIASFGANGAG